MVTEGLYFVWILLMFTLHLSTPVGKIRFATVHSPAPLVNVHLGAWGWCNQVLGECHGPEVGYNVTAFLGRQLRYKEIPDSFSKDTRVHGMMPAVLAFGLITLVLSILALRLGTDVLQVSAIYGTGLLALLTTIYSAIVWKWARDLDSNLKAHTTAHVQYSHGFWLLVPILIIPWILTVCEVMRAQEFEEITVLRLGDGPSSVAPSRRTGRSRRTGGDAGSGGRVIGAGSGRVENTRAPDRHRPTYTFFPEPEGEFMNWRVGNTPPPSDYWGPYGSDTTTYPSSGTTAYPPPHWGQY